MIQSLLRALNKILVNGVILAFFGILFWLTIISLPSPQAGPSAYPAPISAEPVRPTLSPEVLCDQWLSFRKGQPESIRTVLEEDYKNCVNARTTPSPVEVQKPHSSAAPNGLYLSPFYRRSAGIGTIIETNFSPLRSNYRIINQWFADMGDVDIAVYAGGRQSDSATGDDLFSDLSWPGVLVVTETDKSGMALPGRGGVFWTPENSGPVRIVDANGSILSIAAKDGSLFNFDAQNLKFLNTRVGPFLSRSIGDGSLVESGKVPYQLKGFSFVNQWSGPDKNGNMATIFAGNEQDDSLIGVFILLVSLSDDTPKMIESVVYQTNLDDGALRIVNIQSGIITFVSESGLIYEFDLVKRQFPTIPSGSEPLSGNPLVIESSGSGSGLLSVTSTPTRTPTPRPTRTPLPTYNPYP